MEPLVSCSNDEHQTPLKWNRCSHPVTPECRVSHTVGLKHFTFTHNGNNCVIYKEFESNLNILCDYRLENRQILTKSFSNFGKDHLV